MFSTLGLGKLCQETKACLQGYCLSLKFGVPASGIEVDSILRGARLYARSSVAMPTKSSASGNSSFATRQSDSSNFHRTVR